MPIELIVPALQYVKFVLQAFAMYVYLLVQSIRFLVLEDLRPKDLSHLKHEFMSLIASDVGYQLHEHHLNVLFSVEVVLAVDLS